MPRPVPVLLCNLASDVSNWYWVVDHTHNHNTTSYLIVPGGKHVVECLCILEWAETACNATRPNSWNASVCTKLRGASIWHVCQCRVKAASRNVWCDSFGAMLNLLPFGSDILIIFPSRIFFFPGRTRTTKWANWFPEVSKFSREKCKTTQQESNQ